MASFGSIAISVLPWRYYGCHSGKGLSTRSDFDVEKWSTPYPCRTFNVLRKKSEPQLLYVSLQQLFSCTSNLQKIINLSDSSRGCSDICIGLTSTQR